LSLKTEMLANNEALNTWTDNEEGSNGLY